MGPKLYTDIHIHTHTHTQTHTHRHTHAEAHFISLVFLRKCRNKTKKTIYMKPREGNMKGKTQNKIARPD